jgi:transposase
MTPPPDLADKDAVIAALLARIEALMARVAELEAKLGLPPKTPDNSSVPPSKGQKRSDPTVPKDKAKPYGGAHRPLHPNPTSKREVFACRCQGCGADASGVGQSPCETYDRIEIPEIKPDVTRVSLYGGVCPGCARRFKAEPPPGLEPGSPFGPNLRALVIYLRSVQGIPLARLTDVLRDLFGLDISEGASEGALVNILSASREAFAAQTNLIKARLMAGAALASDETGMRVGKANWWLWVFHHADSAIFVAAKHFSRPETKTRSCGSQSAHQSLINRRLRASASSYAQPHSYNRRRGTRHSAGALEKGHDNHDRAPGAIPPADFQNGL